jgi:integrase
MKCSAIRAGDREGAAVWRGITPRGHRAREQDTFRPTPLTGRPSLGVSGTSGSNPLSSRGESRANLTSSITTVRGDGAGDPERQDVDHVGKSDATPPSVTRRQMDGLTRDLAMFNLAIDSKLRGCDVVALRVEDVAPSGYAVDRATVRQKKTGRPVRFELTEQTRQAVDDYIKAAGKKPGEFLFSGRADYNRSMTTRQYARLVSSWVATIGLDPHLFGTHSLRRT